MSSKNTVFTTKEARLAGLTKRELKGLVESGQLQRIERGLYLRRETPQEQICDLFEAASLHIGKPCAICLTSAAAFYQLISELPRQTWIMAPVSKRSKLATIRVFRSRRPFWEIGIDQKDSFSITSIERTLVDMLTNPKTIPLEQAVEALQNALKHKQTDLHKVVAMAGKLKLVKRVSQIIQIVNFLNY